MALKLRRRSEVFTNGILPHHLSKRPSSVLRSGAASFKRMLGGRVTDLRRIADLPNNDCGDPVTLRLDIHAKPSVRSLSDRIMPDCRVLLAWPIESLDALDRVTDSQSTMSAPAPSRETDADPSPAIEAD